MSYQNLDSEITTRLFEVKKNQLKMLRRRGFNIDQEKNILKITLNQFLDTYIPFAKQQKRSFRSVLTNFYVNDDGQKILVYYADIPLESTLLGVNEVSDAIADMVKWKLRNAVIITGKSLSPSATKHITGLVSYNIQIFLEEEMAYDPTEHEFVPEHIPLTIEEQRNFLEENNLSIDQLPILLTNDIIARYYGLRGGTIVKIIRTNLYQTTIVKSVSYRAVKEN